jgi:uncharacterized membrane protein YdbT with pleckstrin-like domain
MIDNADNKTIVEQGYQTLGKKVFWLFFLQVSPAAFIFLLISIIIFIASFQASPPDTPFGDIQQYAPAAALITLIISAFLFAISLTVAWLTYKNYIFMLAEDSFKIKRGFLSKTENAIPYRQIQNVDIERSIIFQMFGLSRLVILTAGHEDETLKDHDEAEGIIPAIDQKLAEFLQTELLKRSDVQKITAAK